MAAALLLTACSGPSAPEPEPDPRRDMIEFDVAKADLDRPCTLVSIKDAQSLTGRPFFDAVALNRVEGHRTRCGLAMGEGGMNGVVQVDLHLGDAHRSSEAIYTSLCRSGSAQPPVLAKTACITADNAYAARVGDWVVVALVRRDPGQINQALSLRLLNVVTPRIEALVRHEGGRLD